MNTMNYMLPLGSGHKLVRVEFEIDAPYKVYVVAVEAQRKSGTWKDLDAWVTDDERAEMVSRFIREERISFEDY